MTKSIKPEKDIITKNKSLSDLKKLAKNIQKEKSDI